ncbi:hypothetical protein [Ensifer adhaerens]|uniref:hypothetical protein n=1 Tax=Ensifer adhaerens TaxID=106592 RepID=UPI00098E8A0B|nr:hypothetical protein [Ensifer adhaerens]
MNIYIVTALSIACAIVGALLVFAPVNKYHRFSAKEVGAIGGIFVFLGVVLMTTFKWSEVVLEVSGAKLQLLRAEDQIKELSEQVAVRDQAIASIKASTEATKQLAAAKELKTQGNITGVWTTANNITPEELKQTLEKSGFTVVPTSEIKNLPEFLAKRDRDWVSG